MLCGMLSAASPRRVCSNARTFLQGHCLHGKFGCLSCTSNHSALCTSIFELYLKAAAELGLKVQRQRKGTNPASPVVPRARRSTGTTVPGPCTKCYAIHCMDSKAGENRLSLHTGRLECVGVEREGEPAKPSIHPCKPFWCFQLCRGLVCSVQLNLCTEMKLWAAVAQSCAARTGPC